jgi:hypothetical protein
MLAELGYKVDTSITPGLDWTAIAASDHRGYTGAPFVVSDSSLAEVPCTIKPPTYRLSRNYARLSLARLGLVPRWLRCFPGSNLSDLTTVTDWAVSQNRPLNLMTHSSELHPGTSPLWRSTGDVNRHIQMYRELFRYWQSRSIIASSLSQFAARFLNGEAVCS